MRKTKDKKSDAMKLLKKLAGGPLILGRAVESIRKGEELSRDECAKGSSCVSEELSQV